MFGKMLAVALIPPMVVEDFQFETHAIGAALAKPFEGEYRGGAEMQLLAHRLCDRGYRKHDYRRWLSSTQDNRVQVKMRIRITISTSVPIPIYIAHLLFPLLTLRVRRLLHARTFQRIG